MIRRHVCTALYIINHDLCMYNLLFFRERLEENEQQNIAIMLMVVVMIFVMCNFLAMVANILEFLKIEAGDLIMVS